MTTENRNAILNAIRAQTTSAFTLAQRMGIPQPSVRRLVRELRAEGWRIVSNYFGYKLQTPERA